MGASPRAGRGREDGEQRGRGAEEALAGARSRAGRARAIPPQRRPRPPRLSAPARESGPQAVAAAGGTMSGAARAGPARLAALALLTCSLWPARADNASQEYYTALINVTVQEPGRGAPLTFRIDRGRYGLDSPKAEVRGQVLAPLPIHGGECQAGGEAGRGAGEGPHPAGPPAPRSRVVGPGARSRWCAARPALVWEGGSRAWLAFPLFLMTWRAFLCVHEACLREGTGLLVCRDGRQRRRWRSAKLSHGGRS